MGRNNADFQYRERDPRIAEGTKCTGPNCDEPATRFSWADGEFCSDCWNDNYAPRTWK